MVIKSSAFWDIMQGSPLRLNRRIERNMPYYLQGSRVGQEDKIIKQAASISPDYRALYRRRQNSSIVSSVYYGNWRIIRDRGSVCYCVVLFIFADTQHGLSNGHKCV
jgi:hypothetical protein